MICAPKEEVVAVFAVAKARINEERWRVKSKSLTLVASVLMFGPR